MHDKLAPILTASVLVAMATPAKSGDLEVDVIGEVVGALAGEERSWLVLERDEPAHGVEAGASAELSVTGISGRASWSLLVQGHDPESDNILTEQTLRMTLRFAALDADAPPPGPGDDFDVEEIMFVAENGMMPDRAYLSESRFDQEPDYLSDGDASDDETPEPAEATLEKLEVDGERGRAAGSFSGTLCLADISEGGIADYDDCMQVSGDFDTEFPVIEVER